MPLTSIEQYPQWAAAHRNKIKPLSITNSIQSFQSYPLVKAFLGPNAERTNHVGTHDLKINAKLVNPVTGGSDIDEEDVVEMVGQIGTATYRPVYYTGRSTAFSAFEMISGSDETIIKNVENRKYEALVDNVEKMERDLCRLPRTDNKDLRGLPYFIVHNSGSPQGFNGQNPSGFSDVQGLDATNLNQAGYRNWTDNYSSITADDLFLKLDIAMDETNFQAAIADPSGQTLSYVDLSMYALFTTKHVVTQVRKFARTQNDDLGMEIVWGGTPLVRGRPLMAVPAFTLPNDRTTMSYDDLPTHPIYGLNQSALSATIVEDWWLKETMTKVANKRHMGAMFVDTLLQMKATDRRQLFVLAQA